MNKKLFLLFLSFNICEFSYPQNIKYPETKKVDQKDTYFNTVVDDPYRWLEFDNTTESNAWIKEQNATTQSYLSKIPFRNDLRAKLQSLSDFKRPFNSSICFLLSNNFAILKLGLNLSLSIRK